MLPRAPGLPSFARRMDALIEIASPRCATAAAPLRHPAEVDRELAGFDLHEGICQELAGTAALATALARRLEREHPAEAEPAREIAALISQAAAKTRNVACALARNTAGAKGLHDALLQLRDSAAGFLPCRLEYPARVELPLAASMHLYRIAHEAIRNAVAHSAATEVVVSLCAFDANVILAIEDDGRGFRMPDSPPRNGGIWEMRRIARSLPATLTIDSRPGCGTRVSCSMPLPEIDRG